MLPNYYFLILMLLYLYYWQEVDGGHGKGGKRKRARILAHREMKIQQRAAFERKNKNKQVVELIDKKISNLKVADDNKDSNLEEFLFQINAQDVANEPLIQPINAYFEQFFAQRLSIDEEEWEKARPTDVERQEMVELINHLYGLDHFDQIDSVRLFLKRNMPELAKSLQLTFIQKKYCIMHEIAPGAMSNIESTSPRRFRRFWGYLILQAPAHSKRPNLHHSSPHFQSDGDVCNEAAAIFEQTGSRSLVVAGASRYAIKGFTNSPCLPMPEYARADAAHNTETMFHTMSVALLEAIKKRGQMVEARFLQWHGMTASSCANFDVFLSAGIGADHSIYAQSDATINMLVSAINRQSEKKRAGTPRNMDSCKLVAKNNLFGRIINGVKANECCEKEAIDENVFGQFIHIEQNPGIRDPDLWTKAINDVIAGKP